MSATAGNLWEWFEPDVALDYRRVTCQGAIPTTSPSASDSTGYPTPSPTKIFDCSKVQGTTFPSCEPTVFIPTDPPSPTSKPVVNYPTAPTTYNPDTTSSASTVSPSLSFSPSPSSKAFAFSFCLLPLLLILSLLL